MEALHLFSSQRAGCTQGDNGAATLPHNPLTRKSNLQRATNRLAAAYLNGRHSCGGSCPGVGRRRGNSIRAGCRPRRRSLLLRLPLVLLLVLLLELLHLLLHVRWQRLLHR